MKTESSSIDIELIAFLQGDIPAVSRPYFELAQRCGISEDQVVERIKDWLSDGKIKRLAGILRHQKAGYDVNAMIAWKVSEESADEIGRQMAALPQVSHCYLRQVDERFPYNFYTMVHSRSKTELEGIIDDMKRFSGLDDYQVLLTERELKKISMKYL